MDHPAPTLEGHVRPWRTATLIVSGVAALELLVLIAIGLIALGRPFLHDAQASAQRKAKASPAHSQPSRPAPVAKPTRPVGPPKLARSKTSVLVLNGNGLEGAASAEAQVVRSHHYVVAAVGNARRTDYARSLVMYRPGFKAEGLRLAGDLRIKGATPLDGLKKSDLKGAHVVVVVGR